MVQPPFGSAAGDPDAPASDPDADALDADGELALPDLDERLPWLESDDEYEPEGPHPGRILAFAAVGLLAVVLVVGVLWWLLRDRPDTELLADGSVIEAPDEPYRTAPEDPGGQPVAGTGATSFEVAEGERVETRIAGSGAVPAPSIDRNPAAAGEAEEPAAEPAPGIGVQVGAYSSRASAEAGWNQLRGRIEALQGRDHRVVQGVADSGTIYRLQALAGTVAEAETLCRTIKAQGGDCQVKR